MSTQTWTQTVTQLGETTLQGRTFQVKELTYAESEFSTVILTGPRGSEYVLSQFASPTGVRKVINMKSGMGRELTIKGNPVRVVFFGGIVKEAK